MDDSIQPIKQRLNILYVLGALFGSGDKKREDTERTFSGAQAPVEERDKGPFAPIIYAGGKQGDFRTQRKGTLLAWRDRRGQGGWG